MTTESISSKQANTITFCSLADVVRDPQYIINLNKNFMIQNQNASFLTNPEDYKH
jgi:hypothetical protein